MDPLLGNWLHWFDPLWGNVALVLVAIGCGAVVGAEREAKEKTAGLRTMILVCLGAAIFTRISLALGEGQGDPARVAAQIVTGVGFLGAGTILHSAGAVRGITTAATIWSVAAIGMVVGSGYAAAGLALSFAVLLILSAVTVLERRYLGPCRHGTARVAFEPAGGKGEVRISEILDEFLIPEEDRTVASGGEGLTEMRFAYCVAHRHHREILARIAALPEVRAIESSSRA